MKKTNKGFSLVELIIVIAIMAILAAALAPALIRYIDKSRKASDLSAAGQIQSAAQAALANTEAYEEVGGTVGNVASATQEHAWTQVKGTHFAADIQSTVGNGPKTKYRKHGADKAQWIVKITDQGGVEVYLGATQLVPSAQGDYAE